MNTTRLRLVGSLIIVTLLAVSSFGILSSAADPEIVNGRFVETRYITVEVYDRSNPGGSPPEDNFYTDFIKEGMLRDHNVVVEFVPVPRWTEVEVLNNLLAAGDAPTSASPTTTQRFRHTPIWAECSIWLLTSRNTKT